MRETLACAPLLLFRLDLYLLLLRGLKWYLIVFCRLLFLVFDLIVVLA